ncbi:hypothetical protein ACL02U_30040 [Streptomyces sp. MS06]|uniref:hypothetical protein n=1 Tax=Streptomyces sp. MS06 TaxID=3385974 RepID=UPI00399FD1A9
MRNHPGPPPSDATPESTAPHFPGSANTLTPIANTFDLAKGSRSGGDQPGVRLVSQRDAGGADVLSVAAEVRQ